MASHRTENHPAPEQTEAHSRRSTVDSVVLCLAKGAGAGNAKYAPGTLGTLIGIGWTLILLTTGNLWAFLFSAAAALLASIPLCSRAEILIRKRDPSQVILDEIVSVPFCFTGWLVYLHTVAAHWPRPSGMVAGAEVWITIAAFLLFRFFDIVKPWPICKLQDIKGGFGIVADDLVAAILTGILIGAFMFIRS
ncbi:MAG: phosphatidylglycerophosphatase A [Verrucomicrobia bacterium]|nr:phosphatidylglycerophosphatase A [Verrucomicrobiota bacterium]MCF7707442.1 phosphatidylglycerophosphatase A [Verrucomicrobiota bacterium]